jgi:hypothetical protein
VEAKGGRHGIIQHLAEQAIGVLPAAGVEQVGGHVGGQEAPHGALDAEAACSLITLGGDLPALLESAHPAQHAAEVEAGPGDGLGVANLLGHPTRLPEVADSRSQITPVRDAGTDHVEGVRFLRPGADLPGDSQCFLRSVAWSMCPASHSAWAWPASTRARSADGSTGSSLVASWKVARDAGSSPASQ